MLNWLKTKKMLLTEIDELKQSRVNLRAELILMTGYRNSWKRKYEEESFRYNKLRKKSKSTLSEQARLTAENMKLRVELSEFKNFMIHEGDMREKFGDWKNRNNESEEVD